MRKKRLAVLVLVVLVLSTVAFAETPTEGEKNMNATSLRLLTANIWGDYFGNPVSVKTNLLKHLKNISPM